MVPTEPLQPSVWLDALENSQHIPGVPYLTSNIYYFANQKIKANKTFWKKESSQRGALHSFSGLEPHQIARSTDSPLPATCQWVKKWASSIELFCTTATLLHFGWNRGSCTVSRNSWVLLPSALRGSILSYKPSGESLRYVEVIYPWHGISICPRQKCTLGIYVENSSSRFK